MSLIAIALDILQEKKDRFIDYEALTQSMLYCDLSELPSLFEQRQKIAESIDQLDQKIQCIARDHAACAQLPAAVRNSCNRSDLPNELQVVFDRAQEIFTIINPLRQQEEEIRLRLEQNQAALLERIKVNHNTSKILKYRTGIQPKLSDGSLLSIHNRNA